MSDTLPTTTLSGATVTAGADVPDTVSVTVNGQTITGWTDVRITRRLEGIPNDFDIGLTVANPTDTSAVVAYAGQPAIVKLGRDTVITGNIDRDTDGGDANSHRLGIIGRGKCADLVDCSAEYPSGQISGADVLGIAAKLAEPYGISVYGGDGYVAGKPIPQFNFILGETAQEIIDRICTYSGHLYYEDEDGDLVIAQVGAGQAASGFVYGQNVKTWSVTNSMDQRFSDYVCSTVSISPLAELGGVGDLFFKTSDPNVPRHRLMYLISESLSGSDDLNKSRALWEASRRAGRATSVTVTVQGWRDAGGTLWTPNTLAPVTLPGLRQAPATMMCISDVTFHRNDEVGTIAEVTLLPPAAFALQPTVIQPTPFATGELTQ